MPRPEDGGRWRLRRYFGETYKWMLYGDDDTLFYMPSVKVRRWSRGRAPGAESVCIGEGGGVSPKRRLGTGTLDPSGRPSPSFRLGSARALMNNSHCPHVRPPARRLYIAVTCRPDPHRRGCWPTLTPSCPSPSPIISGSEPATPISSRRAACRATWGWRPTRRRPPRRRWPRRRRPASPRLSPRCCTSPTSLPCWTGEAATRGGDWVWGRGEGPGRCPSGVSP